MLEKDIDILEKTQRKCLRLFPGGIELESLKERRHWTDMVETFKFIKGMYRTPGEKFFTRSLTHQLRGHSEKLFKPRSRLNIRKYSFSHRVVNPWNNLPGDVVTADSEDMFKTRLLRAVAEA